MAFPTRSPRCTPKPPVRMCSPRTSPGSRPSAAWCAACAAKPLRLAAIGAVASIGAEGAREILIDLTDSDDQEIAEAADEAIASVIIEGGSDDADYEEDASDWIN